MSSSSNLLNSFESEKIKNEKEEKMIDLKRWKQDAKNIQHDLYGRYAGDIWHEFNVKDSDFLITKLCIAVHGFVPENIPEAVEESKEEEHEEMDEIKEDLFEEDISIINDDDYDSMNYIYDEDGDSINRNEKEAILRNKEIQAIKNSPNMENCFTEKQRKPMIKLKDKIYEIGKNAFNNSSVKMMVIFIICKSEEHEFRVPIIRVLTGQVDGKDECKYVDFECRVYKDFNDWKNNNKLPPVFYCYPMFGYYTCNKDGSYEFDIEKPPVLEFGQSPSASIASKLARTADKVSIFGSLGSGALAITSMAVVVNPLLLAGGVVVGGLSAVYGGGRMINHLVDKKTHDENMKDYDSIMCYIGLASLPLNFATSIANSIFASGAQSGRIFSTTARGVGTSLMWTSMTTNAAMLIGTVVNLNEKRKNKQLTTLDIVQFSMGVFFFSNMVLQPKTAASVIKRAQHEHIESFKTSMNDDVKQSYEAFVETNVADSNNIVENSKLIRTVNKIENAGEFFKKIDGGNAIIGGRKGKTILVGKDNTVSRIRTKDMSTVQHNKMDAKIFESKLETLRNQDLIKTEISGNKVFEYGKHSAEVQSIMSSTMTKVGIYKDEIFLLAQKVAEHFNIKISGNYWYIVEIIISYTKGSEEKAGKMLKHFLFGGGFEKLIKDIKKDVKRAVELAKAAVIVFKNYWKAVYYYLKYGSEYTYLFSNEFTFYLDNHVQKLIQESDKIHKVDEFTNLDYYHHCTDNCSEFVVVEKYKNGRLLAIKFPNMSLSQIFAENLKNVKIEEKSMSIDDSVKQHKTKTEKNVDFLFYCKNNKETITLKELKANETYKMLQNISDMILALTPQ